MKQDIQVTTTLPVLQTNFETVSAALDEQLKQYEGLVVTPDNIKQAKKDATDINKLAGQIDTKRKDAVSEVSQPIKKFESQMKDLRDRCKAVRQGIIDQVKVYEDQVREQARDLLAGTRAQLWEQHEVREEYCRAEFEDLITLSAVTGKGNLAKSTREALEGRIKGDKAAQDLVDRRLLELERDSYAAGLGAPLTINHVRHIIEADEDEYQASLQSIMKSELDREQQAEIRRRQKAERDQQAREQAEREQAQHEAEQESQKQVEAAAQAAQKAASGPDTPVEDGQTHYRLTAVFDIAVPADKSITAEQVKDHVSKRLQDAGVPAPSYMEASHVGA